MKLNYKQIEYKNLVINYAKHRKTRHIKLLINHKKQIFVTVPIYVTNIELMQYIEQKEYWIRKTINKIENKKTIEISGILTKEQKIILTNKISQYIQKYEILMNIKVEKFTIRNMKTLWGSCTFKTYRIRFNSKLFFMSDAFIEYVVVHEMCHLFIPNHSAEFYKMIAKYIPNYKMIRKESKNVMLD